MKTHFCRITCVAVVFLLSASASAQQMDSLPTYLRDRGTALPTSMFGTYINQGDFYVYPFYEYYYDRNSEYAPNELGGVSDADYRGKFTGNEGLIFLGYGISDRLAVEMEAAYISARLERAADDPEGANEVVRESGIGDVEAQVRWRWNKESKSRPELFSYFETVFPKQKDKKLIGTSDWELKLGSGIVKGFTWGTMTVRYAMEYNGAENKVETGEFALEYLRRISDFFRFYTGIEGTQDELELIIDLQFHLSDHVFLRVNNAFGVTSKATDYAPELGCAFRF